MVIVGSMVVGILLLLAVLSAVVMGGALANKNIRADVERDAEKRASRRHDGPGPAGGEPVHV
ncbi:hypothetical protein [Corallococcus llansteffanensis]|uniref:Uncharacterized protein n=1 Tax=Corallococcus llansteffanensis TaxID=2316731 RepID=A0A3A8NPW4_9BACT|nr:hypothetical protein [Corallococcus llansteffanensis]RKH45430.1 hypothetical protein D7V93_35445 [Corallococcus llansteffanensis]